MPIALKELAEISLRLVFSYDVIGYGAQDLLDDDPALEPRQMVPQATVKTMSEVHASRGAGPADVESIRVLEFPFVPAGRLVEKDDRIAFLHRLAESRGLRTKAGLLWVSFALVLIY